MIKGNWLWVGAVGLILGSAVLLSSGSSGYGYQKVEVSDASVLLRTLRPYAPAKLEKYSSLYTVSWQGKFYGVSRDSVVSLHLLLTNQGSGPLCLEVEKGEYILVNAYADKCT